MSTLTKKECVERILVESISMLYGQREKLAIRLLAHSAWRVLYDLHKNRNTELIADFEAAILPGKKREFYKTLSGPINFLKHAEKDPSGELEDFDASVNDGILWLACIKFRDLFHGENISEIIKLHSDLMFLSYPKVMKPNSDLAKRCAKLGFPWPPEPPIGRDRRFKIAISCGLLT